MAARKIEQARRDLSAARRAWREALESAGLPAEITPKQIKAFLQLSEKGTQIRHRLEQQQQQLQQRRAEIDGFAARVRQVSADAKEDVADDDPLAQLAFLAEALTEQHQRVERRDKLRRQLRKLRRQETRFSEAAAQAEISPPAIAASGWAWRANRSCARRPPSRPAAEGLRKDRDTLSREITAAIGGHCPEQAVGEQILSDVTGSRLESLQADLALRLQLLEKQLPGTLRKSRPVGRAARGPGRRSPASRQAYRPGHRRKATGRRDPPVAGPGRNQPHPRIDSRHL